MSSLKESFRFTGPQPIRRAKFPAFVCDRFMNPIKLKECQRTRPWRVSLVWRQRGVCEMVVHDRFRREVWSSCFSRAWLIGDDVLFWPLLFASSFISSSNCNVKSGCCVNLIVKVQCVCITKVQQTDNITTTCSWRLALLGRPYMVIPSKVTSDYSVSDWD